MKKLFAMLLSMSMLATMLTACGGDSGRDTTEDTTTTTTSAEADAGAESDDTEENTNEESETDAEEETSETSSAEDVIVLPEGVAVEDGDAYLAFGDGEWWLQYAGKDMDALSFGATVAHIDGAGTYTVGLDASNADAVTMNGVDVIGGCSFSAVVIQNGEELFPDQSISITVDKIVIDGTEVELVANNYNNYEDGNLRTNIYNSYVSEAPTENVWTATGSLDNISAQIIPVDAFSSFSKIEVTFTITETGDGASTEGEDTSEDDSTGDTSVEEENETVEETATEEEVAE